MLTSLITLLVLALVLWLVYYIVGMFIKGQPLTIIGIILGLILLIFALKQFGLVNL